LIGFGNKAQLFTSCINTDLPLSPNNIVNQKYLKSGIICGIVGILLLSCSSLVQSKSPIENRLAKGETTPTIQTIPDLKPTPQVQKLPVSSQFTINGKTVLLEVARTAQEQSTGLMNRTELANNRGMLFVFSPPRPVSFWMKNTLIPLDMVFVSNGVVKYIGNSITPCQADPCPTYGPEPRTDIDGVIELRGGRATELQIKVGDRVKVVKYSAKRRK
jgi:uncharacterized protein